CSPNRQRELRGGSGLFQGVPRTSPTAVECRAMGARGTAPLPKTRRRAYTRHGLNTLRRALTASAKRFMSRRYKLGRALWDWRRDLVDALGGDDRISPQQLTLMSEGNVNGLPAAVAPPLVPVTAT